MALLTMTMGAWAGMCTHLSEPRYDFQFFAGYSPESLTLIGTETGRRFVAAGLGYTYLCWAWDQISIGYTASALPAAIVLQPAQIEIAATIPAGAPLSFTKSVPAHAVYGFGVTPVGGTVNFVRRAKVHPFFEFGLGIIASTEPIPENVIDATGLNFLVDFGAGARWKNISLGYKFLHVSNANTTRFNPGLDNGIIYAGYSFAR